MSVRWEYMVSYSRNWFDYKQLNIFGEQGWELTAVTGADISWAYYFKRPVGV